MIRSGIMPMKKGFLIIAVVLGVIISCSEKCPLEPYSETCGELYGMLYPPEESALPVRDLRMLAITGSCGLNRDNSFCLPGLPGTGTGVVVAAIRDTVPVMLGYVFPEHIITGTGEEVPLVLDAGLRSIVLGETGGVRISAASTVLTLVMLNPFLGGASAQERARFAYLVARHTGFSTLAADVKAALASSPEDVLDPDINSDLYAKATIILSDVLALEGKRLGDPPSPAPYVIDGPADYVKLVNPTFVHFGVRVAGEGVAAPDTVFLVPPREVDWLVTPADLTPCEYLLGSGRFDIEFFKGFGGFSAGQRLNPDHPGGLATIANTGQTVWNLLTVLAGCADLVDPGSMGIRDAALVEDLCEAIEAGDTGKVLDLSVEYLCENPSDLSNWLGERLPGILDAQRYLASVRGILTANAAQIEAAGLGHRLPFYSALHAAAYHESLLVCQRDGVIVPCENAPLLTQGGVSPAFGYTDSVFTYSVRYYDHEGQAPLDKRVVIDGNGFTMELAGGTPADGIYRYSTTLAAGMHAYCFEGTDTHGDTGRLPASGVFEGPSVGSYPVLSEGRVEPVTGYTRDRFAYSVDYHDQDGAPPVYMRVVIDGEPVDMAPASGDESDGRYSHTAEMAAGAHTYYFRCGDPMGASVRLPVSGLIEGPAVSYAPELSDGKVFPAMGSIYTGFKFEVDYCDGDGDAPGYVRVNIDDGPGKEMILKSGTPGDGTYCYETALPLGSHEYRFECADTGGAATRLPDSGTLTGPMVYAPEGKNPNAKVAVHVRAHDAKAGCDYGTIESCLDITTTFPGFSVDAFPVFFDLVEYQALEYGLTWPDWAYSAAWHSCCDVTVGEIRWPGDGVSQMWDECRSGWCAVPGYIWLYSDYAGYVCLCGHPGTGEIHIFDCSGGMDQPVVNICAGVYGACGDDPCPP